MTRHERVKINSNIQIVHIGISLSPVLKYTTHIHIPIQTHTHTRVYIYVCVCVCICVYVSRAISVVLLSIYNEIDQHIQYCES